MASTGCPCGRYHPPAGFRRALRRKPQEPVALGHKILQARWSGKETDLGGGFHAVAYHGDCIAPFSVHADDGRKRHATYTVRCRKCGPCRRAKRNYWGFAAMEVTRETMEHGNRTWFGTLTLCPEAQVQLLRRARDAHREPHAEWWADPHCDERFAAVRVQFLRECQKYWKRLRKAGHRFRYLLVFERHQSGLPHAHFLLHEEAGAIRKRELRGQWPLGFIQASLVGGRARNAAAPEKAAWYAVKYLTKSHQARVVASRGYAPEKRDLGPKPPKGGVFNQGSSVSGARRSPGPFAQQKKEGRDDRRRYPDDERVNEDENVGANSVEETSECQH